MPSADPTLKPRLADVTPIAWTPRGSLTLEDWIRCGRQFASLSRACGWWIGDWLNFGNVAYGQKYSRAASVSKYDMQTLMNMAYVASRFEVSRRREDVSWSHHAELAALPPDEQEQWLDRVEADRFTVKDLRFEMRRERGVSTPPKARGPALRRQGAGLGLTAEQARYRCPRCGHAYAPASDT